MTGERLRLAWAVSGQGRSLRAVLEAADLDLIPVDVVLVVTDRASSIEAEARRRNIAFQHLEPQEGRFHPRLVECLAPLSAEWMGLTFNRLLTDEVIDYFGGRIFNLHMSLLPLFPGFGALSRMLESGMRMSGVTLNLVDNSIDLGPILSQAACAVSSADTRETLGRRLFDVSLPILLQLIRSIADRELTYDRQNGLIWPRAAAPVGTSNAFPSVDRDLARFAADFCARLKSG